MIPINCWCEKVGLPQRPVGSWAARQEPWPSRFSSGRASRRGVRQQMYSLTNAETPPRPNRISGYAFNPAGGLGSGAFFQDPIISSGRQAAMQCLMLVVARELAKLPMQVCQSDLQRQRMSRQRRQLEEILVVPG